jgi:hypothetical protein
MASDGHQQTAWPAPAGRAVPAHELMQPIDYDGSIEILADGTCCEDKKSYSACYCPPPWAHRCGVFGELLYLRARDAEVAYAVPINGPIDAGDIGVQVGAIRSVDQDFEPAFRVGASLAFDHCSSLVFTWAHFDSSNSDSIDIPGGREPVIHPLTLHPSAYDTGTPGQIASATADIRFDTLDADYRSVLHLGKCSVINWLAGLRYARLEQEFHGSYSFGGEEQESFTDITFDGAGVRLGLDAERYAACGFLLYGRGMLNVLAGEFQTRYRQMENFDSEVVNTAWKSGRLMPILELELGVGWQSCCGRFRLTAGYMVNYWFNAVTTDQWIDQVQQNSFVGQPDGMSFDTLTFDGLTTRAEFRF